MKVKEHLRELGDLVCSHWNTVWYQVPLSWAAILFRREPQTALGASARPQRSCSEVQLNGLASFFGKDLAVATFSVWCGGHPWPQHELYYCGAHLSEVMAILAVNKCVSVSAPQCRSVPKPFPWFTTQFSFSVFSFLHSFPVFHLSEMHAAWLSQWELRSLEMCV
jgi:hypothetical protein